MTQQYLITRLKAVEEALTYGARREASWNARKVPCSCDHNEICDQCYPPAFREGGEFYLTPGEVRSSALSDLRELIKEAEEQKPVLPEYKTEFREYKAIYTALGEKL